MTEPEDVRRTRRGYDEVAELYHSMFEHALAASPFDRAMLGVFAERVGTGAVADLGCGPGRITTHLAALGLDVFGIDLSPEMIRLARAARPDLRYVVGSMENLAVPDAALAGIVSWYSVIHTPPVRVPIIVAEFRRVLAPGGQVALAFQTTEGDDVRTHDHKVAPSYLWPPDRIEELLGEGGFRTVARLVREPDDEAHPPAYLLAEKSSAS
ncbi:class I SAM-dependent methyltransferase [Nocardia wallacei]|uniref:class I SAM-dependent methyltransferase n=1 Tax=Nocardia wallacei TaxID=480035 RepID=UPI0024539012|nr:class I SAM-dependent methyltransferase [Nocardia wallacei]